MVPLPYINLKDYKILQTAEAGSVLDISPPISSGSVCCITTLGIKSAIQYNPRCTL